MTSFDPSNPLATGIYRNRLVAHCMQIALAVTGVCATTLATAAASDHELSIEALKAMSVEELLNIEVTSASKRPEMLLRAPAAIQVLTGEDIRRSGASSIPGALRLSNNLDVARENAHEWVISARGFSSDVGNKLLVLVDGRSVYTPLFSGVFWDRQDYLLADLDRIEIISGPGGALWGANAVNGVINITTKRAEDTQGLYLEAGAGTDPESFASIRQGGSWGEDTYFRVYGKYSGRSGQSLPDGADAVDAWHAAQGGFRIDSELSSRDSLTVQGDYYRNEERITTGGVSTVSGGNVLGRWSKRFAGDSEMSLQVYYDRTHLMLPVPALILAPAGTLQDDLDTADVDFQHRFRWGDDHLIVWGLGYRYTHDVVDNAPALAFYPEVLDQQLLSGFVQDEISLRDDLALTLGTKLEHTDYTGFEVEPNVRLQWNLSDRQSVWAAISRAVRTPARIDRDISQPDPAYFFVLLKGGSNFDSETLVAYELGYRGQLNPTLNASLATFYNDYDNLRSTSTSPPDPVFGLPFPFFFENNLEGETYGFELSTDAQLMEHWRLHAAYRLLKEDIRVKPGHTDFNNALNETSDPQQQISLRSSMDLPYGGELDMGLRWIDNRRLNDAGMPATVPDYLELNVRLGWHLSDTIELSVLGRNLLHDQHAEYGLPGPTQVQIERSVYGKLVWRY